jgi:hypothetical protein
MICLDSDVLVIHHHYKDDARYQTNLLFMQKSKGLERGTTIYNVTWNTKHFAGKTAINVQTPEEWLREHTRTSNLVTRGGL